jgi:hypothetical protein
VTLFVLMFSSTRLLTLPIGYTYPVRGPTGINRQTPFFTPVLFYLFISVVSARALIERFNKNLPSALVFVYVVLFNVVDPSAAVLPGGMFKVRYSANKRRGPLPQHASCQTPFLDTCCSWSRFAIERSEFWGGGQPTVVSLCPRSLRRLLVFCLLRRRHLSKLVQPHL